MSDYRCKRNKCGRRENGTFKRTGFVISAFLFNASEHIDYRFSMETLFTAMKQCPTAQMTFSIIDARTPVTVTVNVVSQIP